MARSMNAPFIKRLRIERFRGIKELSWHPDPGINIILGGGDVGKTTVLEAIGLLLNPSNYASISDADYYGRDVASRFRIDAVMSLPTSTGIEQQRKHAWVWEWNGEDAAVPDVASDGVPSGDPVYRLRVEGTDELDLVHQIVQPDGSLGPLFASLRRAIGLLRLAGDDRNDRDLRLVHGSVLDRLISDKGLRARVTRELASREVAGELQEEARAALGALETAFEKKALPSGLNLGVTGGQGASVGAMIGLTATHDGVPLPLASWGAGTRRVAALAIAEQTQEQFPITLVDEVERGLEPYRQRVLMQEFGKGNNQVFLTTHSPAAISGSENARLWHLDANGRIGPLKGKKITQQRKWDPEAFLARLTIVAEGLTEVGFVGRLLEAELHGELEHYGIHLTNGDGHERSLILLLRLSQAGVRFAGFLDREKSREHPKQWKRITEELGDLAFRWQQGCTEENIIGVLPDDRLDRLIDDPRGEKTGERLRTIADRLRETDKSLANLREVAGGQFRTLIMEAATGRVPSGADEETRKAYRKHGQHWFKSLDGGRELAEKLLGLPKTASQPAMSEVQPFLDAIVRHAKGVTEAGSIKK